MESSTSIKNFTTMFYIKCKYCGQKAGLFKRVHKHCEDRHRNGRMDIQRHARDALHGTLRLDGLKQKIYDIAADCHISDEEVGDVILVTFSVFVSQVLDQGLITPEQEERVVLFEREVEMKQSFLDSFGDYSKLVKSRIIRELTEGKIPEEIQELIPNLPFILQKDEYLVWVERRSIFFYEQTSQTTYTGGYAGIGIRVAKGLYFRTGGFKGNPVHTSEMKLIGLGMFGLTNKHIYFYSPERTFRIPFKKIVAVNAFHDSVSLQQDGSRSKPQIFQGVDGWFVYNVIANMSRA